MINFVHFKKCVLKIVNIIFFKNFRNCVLADFFTVNYYGYPVAKCFRFRHDVGGYNYKLTIITKLFEIVENTIPKGLLLPSRDTAMASNPVLINTFG